MATMVNSPNGPRRRDAFDGWFRYPAGFSVEALDACVAAIGSATKNRVVADAFAGVATVGHRALHEGWGFCGLEAHPLVARIAALKFARPDRPEALVDAARVLVANAELGSVGDEHELLRRAFSDEMLAQLAGFRDALPAAPARWRPYLELALISILRDHASVKVGWPYQLPRKPRNPRSTDPGGRLIGRATRFAEDLANAPVGDASVLCGDARTARAWRKLAVFEPNAVISSPPYLNNFDYADATRLELYFLREAASWKEMCERVRAGMVVASTQQSHEAPAQRALARLRDLPELHGALASIVEQLTIERDRGSRRWGKQYNWLASLYFRDLRRVFEHMRETLPAGSPVAFVIGDSAPYGVYVDTPGLLSTMAQELGFEELSTQVLRDRGERWRTNGSRHQVALCERLVVWRAPGPVKPAASITAS
jgi:hypothetical protein